MAVLALSLLSCGREITGPGEGLRYASGLSFVAEFPAPLASVAAGAGAVVPFTQVRVVFRRADLSVALDTLVNFPSNADSIALDLRVPLAASASASEGEPLALTLAYVNAAGDTVFRGGPVPVLAQVRAPGSPPPPPAAVPLTYVGPGAQATGILMVPETLTVTAGDPFTFTATARDGQGSVIAGAPIVFTTLDPSRATLGSPAGGAGTSTALRGIARIRAQLASGAAEDTSVLVVLPRPSALAIVSGGAQTAGANAALPQPVSVRLTATDGQPLAGAAVTVAVTSGGGSVVPTGTVTDGQGLIGFAWTLGAAAGSQSVTVSSAGVPNLVVNATAVVLSATQLVITQEVGSTYQAGDSIPALLVEARTSGGVRDTTYGDSVFLAFAANPAGASFTGVTRVRALAGLARFDNFRLTRAGTGYRLSVNAAGMSPDTSAVIAVTARAASVLGLVSGGGQVAAPGAALAQPIVVRTTDGYANPVAGVIVAFATTNGTTSAAADTSDASGLASVGWTLPVSTGLKVLTVTSAGLTGSPLTVNATASAGVATTTLAPQLDTLTAIGATRLLVATARDGAGGVTAGTFSWGSRDSSRVTVDSTGRARAVANGATWVIVTEAGGTRDSARIVVEQRLASIAVTPGARSIYLGASFAFTASAVDGLGVPLAAQPSFAWSTLSGAIASITTGGIATGVGLGATQVRATAGAVTGISNLTVITPITRIAVVRDSATFVASDTFSLAALASTRSYRAVAYDTLNVVMPGISFAWASSNPSVASLDSVGTATARALSAANGFTAIRASAQGVVGAAALTVAQVMTAVDLSPGTATVAPTGSVVLTARRRDANGYFIPGGAFTFTSAAPGIATVTAGGVVTGVAIGSTTITATSGAITSATPATITVTNSVPPIISFGRDTLAIGRSATNVSIPVYLSRPFASNVTVNLAVADTFAFFSPTSVTIAAGSTVGTAQLNGRNAGTTRIFATDGGGGGGYAGDTAVLAVQASVRFTSGGYTLLVNDEVSTQILLTDPAPVGGTYITYSFGTPGRASVSPDPAFIPAGQLAANVVIRAIGAGGTTITPAATGVTGTSTSVTTQAAVLTLYQPLIRVGAGQYRNDWYVATPSNVNNGFPVTLTSSDTTSFTTVPAIATLPGGTYYVYFTVRAKAVGSGTVTATAAGWTPDTKNVIVTTPRVRIVSGGGTLNTTSPATSLTIYSTDSTFQASWRSSDLAISISSSDTTVMRVTTPTVVIPADQYFTNTPRVVPGGTPGTAWIRVTASGHFSDSVQYTVVGPRIRVALGAVRVGAGQNRPDGYVYAPDNVTAPLVVRLVSSNPAVAAVPDSVIIPAGTYYAYYPLRGLTPGTVQLTVTAPGYTRDSVFFTVTSPKLQVSGGGTYNNYSPPVAFTVYSADSLNGVHYANDTIRVSYSSSDTSVVRVTVPDTILPGEYYSQSGRVSFVGAGTAWVRATTPGYRPDSILYTVVQPKVQFSFNTYRIGRRQYRPTTDFYVYVPDNVAAPLNVTVTQTNTGADSLSRTDFTIGSGTYYTYFGLAGLQTGIDTLIVSAPGYFPDTAFVIVTSRRITGGSIPGTATTTTPPAATTIFITDSLGGAHYSLDTLLFSARSSNDAVLQPDSVGFRLPRGTYYVQPRMRFVGPGSASLTWSDSLGAGFGSLTSNSVTITGPSLGFANSSPVLGMRQYSAGTGAYVTIPNAIGAPLVVRLLSTDPTVATVPDSVIVPAGQTYAYVDIRAQDVVGTVQIQATALGYASANVTQQVTTPRFLLNVSANVRTTQSPPGITVQAADASGAAHYVWEPVTVTFASSFPSAATVDSTSVVIPAGQYYNNSARLLPVAPGTTTITVSDPRVQSYRYTDASAPVAVVLPTLGNSWGTSPLRLAVGQWREDGYIATTDNQVTPLNIALTHATSASTSAASIQIPNGTYYLYHRITGAAIGVDTITYSAAGHVSARGPVIVGTGRVDALGSWPATIGGATDSVAVTLYARDMDGNVRNVSVATTFNVAVSGGALDIRFGGATVTSVTIPADAQSVTFYLRRLANGTATVTFTNANYTTQVAPTVTVSIP
ncbi:MAG: Ig-like domain-containing protein [Gemmatimonadetes bacterium]|nr:Ig-like domain-containing protein [Gemmatimonadota bacterium]